MSTFLRLVLIIVLVLIGYYGFLFVVQRHLLYPAPHGPAATVVPPDVRHIQLQSVDGPIDAWYLPPVNTAPGPRPALIFTHGNAERAEDWTNQFRDFQRAGMGVLVPEYPGYGISAGRPSQSSITNAVLVAYDWLRAQPGIDSTRIIAYGRSIGGGAATRLATRRHVAALVLESSFTSLRAFAGRFFAPGFLVRDPFDNLVELRRFRGPLLVLHGQRDEIAPFAHGQALAAAVPGAQFVAMDCGHNDCERPWRDVVRFIAQHGLLDSLPHN